MVLEAGTPRAWTRNDVGGSSRTRQVPPDRFIVRPTLTLLVARPAERRDREGEAPGLPTTANSIPAAAVRVSQQGEKTILQQNTTVELPAEYAEDPMVLVRGTDIRRWRTRLKLLLGGRGVLTEVLIGIAMLAFGGSLGALSSGVTLSSSTGPFFYVLLPVLGTSTFIVHVALRSGEVKSAKSIAQEIVADLSKIGPAEEKSEDR
jgi:hypothetical protein